MQKQCPLDIIATCILQVTSTILGELLGEINTTNFSLFTNYLDDKVLYMFMQFMYISVRLQFFILFTENELVD